MTDAPEDVVTMLKVWRNSVAVMHIAHHVAASKATRRHRQIGSLAAILAGIVGAGILGLFGTENQGGWLVIVAGLGSLLAAALAALTTFLDYDTRAGRHHTAASGFGSVRREIEELIAIGNHKKESLDQVRTHWDTVLKAAPPLPKKIHDGVKSEREVWNEANLLPEGSPQ